MLLKYLRKVNFIVLPLIKDLQLVSKLMPHIHLIIGLIIVNVLHIDYSVNLLFLLGCILPDADIIVGIQRKRNHRTFFTHYPIFWISLTIFAVFLDSIFSWFFLGGVVHVLSDVLDWKVFLFAPFSGYSASVFNLNPNEILSNLSPKTSILSYYQQPQIIFSEVIIFLLGVVSFIWR